MPPEMRRNGGGRETRREEGQGETESEERREGRGRRMEMTLSLDLKPAGSSNPYFFLVGESDDFF